MKTCATDGTQVANLCYWDKRSEGLLVPREPALLASAGMDAGAQPASRERSPGWAERASGDGAWAVPKRAVEQSQVENLCYELRTGCQPVLRAVERRVYDAKATARSAATRALLRSSASFVFTLAPPVRARIRSSR